jgi:hypothetical protein
MERSIEECDGKIIVKPYFCIRLHKDFKTGVKVDFTLIFSSLK